MKFMLLFLPIFITCKVHAQSNVPSLIHADSILQKTDSLVLKKLQSLIKNLSPESLLKQQIATINKAIPKVENPFEEKAKNDTAASFISFKATELSNDLSAMPLIYDDSSQLMIQNNIQTNFSFVAKGKYGFTGYALYRKTFEGPLPDFFDFHISYTGNVPVLRLPVTDAKQLQQLFLKSNVFDNALNTIKSELSQFDQLVDVNGIERRVLTAKETVSNFRSDAGYRFTDSTTVAIARSLLAWNEKYKNKIADLQNLVDSIEGYRNQFAYLLQKGISKDQLLKFAADKTPLAAIRDSLNNSAQVKTEPLKRGLSKLSMGRVFPYQSELSLKNNSLRGVDIRYDAGRYMFGLSGGLIDFRLNGLIRQRKIETPMPYVIVLYAGYKLTPHLTTGIRFFNGRKDNYTSGINKPVTRGISVELAYHSKGKMLAIEVAKNATQPGHIMDTIPKKQFWDVGDRENMAVAVKGSFIIPAIRTSISGSIAAQGKYYSAFNNLAINTQTKNYDLKINQNLFGNAVRISGWLRNTEYTPALNGIILQNNVALKSFSASLQKAKWPVVSIGYNPVKQTFINDSLVQVMIYHAVSFFSSYNYKLGIRNANTTIVLNKLDNKETGGLPQSYFGNSTNLVMTQRIDFDVYSSLVDINWTESPGFLFATFKGAFEINTNRDTHLQFGATVNHFNRRVNKIGGNLTADFKVGERGTLAMSYNRSFLPSVTGKQLTAFNYGNLSFRYNLIH